MSLREHIQTAKKERKQKPTVREYLSANPHEDGVSFLVHGIDLTRNGDWMRVQTDSFVGFIHADSELAETLLNILEQSDGKWGYALLAVLDASENKYQFSIDLDKSNKRFYRYSSMDKAVSISDVEKKLGKQTSLKLEDFGFTNSKLESGLQNGKLEDLNSDIGGVTPSGKRRTTGQKSKSKVSDLPSS